jgi:hypothetical protein
MTGTETTGTETTGTETTGTGMTGTRKEEGLHLRRSLLALNAISPVIMLLAVLT